MLEEFYYTLNIDHKTVPELDTLVVTVPTYLEAVTGAHAIAVLTEWDEFIHYDYQAIYNVMSKPAFIFDGRGILPHNELRKIGFEVYAIGKPNHFKF